MVKSLFGTSALAGLALFALGSAPVYAETLTSGAVPPSLKINGFTSINAYVLNQQRRENGRGGPQPHIGVDASNLFFTILGYSVNGIEYMYRVNLETIPGTSTPVQGNYGQIKGSFGTFQVGNIVGPEDTMIWDAGKIIGGTGGFDGGYNNVYNMSAGVMRGNDNIGDTGIATKVVWYSPEVKGWQVGVAYTPSTAHQGDGKLDNMTGGTAKLPGNRGLYEVKGNQPFDLRNVAIGLTYKKEIGKWNITLSGAGITAKSYFFNSNIANNTASGRVPFQNTKAYQLGFVVGYGDFRFGGGYLDNGKSHLPRSPNFTYGGSTGDKVNLTSMNNGNAGHAWNVGAGCTLGAYQLSASYQRTNRNTGNFQKAHSDFYSAALDVNLFRGLGIYTQVDYIRSQTNSVAIARETAFLNNQSGNSNVGVGNNSGLLGIVGTKISF
jgi:hypothetical protein